MKENMVYSRLYTRERLTAREVQEEEEFPGLESCASGLEQHRQEEVSPFAINILKHKNYYMIDTMYQL